MDHVILIPPEWGALSEDERNGSVRRVKCTVCFAAAHQRCTSQGSEDPLPPYSSRYSWALEPYHPLRWVDAEALYRRERQVVIEHVRLEEMRLAFDISRTCPWCGTMFDTVILMEEHEVGCE